MRTYLGILTILFLSAACLLKASTYYVSHSEGNDGNDGLSETSPWKTLNKVNNQAFQPGDVILFKRGDLWRESLIPPSSGTDGNPITFSAYGDSSQPNPHITGGEIVPGFTLHEGTVYRAGLTEKPYIVTIDDDYWKVSGSISGLDDGDYRWENGFLYIRDDRGNPSENGRVVQASQRNHAVISDNSVDAKYIVIDNFLLTRTNGALVEVDGGARDWMISNNRMFFANSANNTHGSGVHLSTADNVTIHGNYLRYMLGDGILVFGGSDNCTISNNDIALIFKGVNGGGDCIQVSSNNPGGSDNFKILNNVVSMQYTDSPKGCIIQERSDNGIIAGNTCYYGDFGIEFNGNNIIVENNTILYTAVESGEVSRGGIFTSDDQPIDNCTIRNNVILYAAHKGIFITQTANTVSRPDQPRTNIKIYNNTIFECGDGLVTNDTGGEFKNNIIWSRSQSEGLVRISSIPDGHDFVLENNIYGPAGANELFRINGVQYNSLADFQAAGYDAGSMVAYPKFTDLVNFDFRVQPGSPAIDAGLTLAGFDYDHDDNPRPVDNAWDIGAYEGAVVAPTVTPGLYFYEGFGYTVGTGTLDAENGGSGWGGPWQNIGNGDIEIIEASFEDSTIQSTGGRLRVAPKAQEVTRPLDRAIGRQDGSVWLSLFARKNATSRDAFFHFEGFGLRQSGSSDWELITPDGERTAIEGATTNSTHLFLIRVDFTAARDIVYLWLNPDLSAGEPSLIDATVSRAVDDFEFKSLNVKADNFGNSSENAEYDEIRVGKTFNDILTKTTSDFSPNQAPTAVAEMNTSSALTNQNIDFSGLNSFDSDGTVDRYLWDFGDGTQSTGSETSHTYTTPGSYTVKLAVEDALGASDTASLSLYINEPPTASASVNRSSISVDESVTFDGTGSSDTNGTISSYLWTFSDGAPSSSDAVYTRSFKQAGIVTATLQVTDNDGVTNTFSLDILVIETDFGDSPLIAYDGFNYPNDTILDGSDGGVGWGRPWAGTVSGTYVRTQGSSGFTHPGVATTGSVYARLRGNLERSLANPIQSEAGEVWVSFFLMSSNSSRTATFRLMENGSSVYNVLHQPADNLKLTGMGDIGVPSGSGERFVLLKIEFDPNGNRVWVWVDPDLTAGQPGDASADGSATLADNFGIDGVLLEHSSSSSHESNFDEIRLATSFEQAVGGVLGANTQFEITGLSSGGDYQPIQVNGDLQLSGDLSVFFNGFTPAQGDAFTLIEADSADALFSTVTLPTPPFNLFYLVQYRPKSVTLEVVSNFEWTAYKRSIFSVSEQADSSISSFESDIDGDGKVNGLEFVLGTNPKIPDTERNNIRLDFVTSDSSEYPVFSYPQRPGSTGYTATLLTTEQLSEGIWSTASTTESTTTEADGRIRSTLQSTTPLGSSPRFFQLTVSP